MLKLRKVRALLPFYERLRDSNEEMSRFMDFAGVPAEDLDWQRIKQPSRVSHSKTTFTSDSGDSKPYSPEERGKEIVELFGLSEWVQW